MPRIAGCFLITLCWVSGAVTEAHQREVALVGRASLIRCRAASGSKLRGWSFKRPFENITVSVYSNYDGGSPTVNCRNCSVLVDQHGSSALYFNFTQLQHGGIYTCTVRNSSWYETKFQAELIVLDPHVQCESDHLKGDLKGIMEDSKVEIRCNVSFAGNIVPVIKWFRNNDKISSSSHIEKYVDRIGWFYFKKVLQLNASDNGMSFRCEVDFEALNQSEFIQSKLSNATNVQNAFKWNFTAVVWYMPRNIRIESAKTIYNFGDRVECSADGNPSPKFTWSCDNGTTREGSVLTLDADTFEVDVNYACQCTAMSSIFNTTVSETVVIGITLKTDNALTTLPMIVIAVSVVAAAVVVVAAAVAAVVIDAKCKGFLCCAANNDPDVVQQEELCKTPATTAAAAADTSNESTEIPVYGEVRKPSAGPSGLKTEKRRPEASAKEISYNADQDDAVIYLDLRGKGGKGNMSKSPPVALPTMSQTAMFNQSEYAAIDHVLQPPPLKKRNN